MGRDESSKVGGGGLFASPPPSSPLPGSGSAALSAAPIRASQLRRFLLGQKRAFSCSRGGGGDSGERPLPLTAASPAPPRPPSLARPPTSGKARGVWPEAAIKSRGAVPGRRSVPSPPPSAPGRGCGAAPRWLGSLLSSALANFPGSFSARQRGRPVSPRSPGPALQALLPCAPRCPPARPRSLPAPGAGAPSSPDHAAPLPRGRAAAGRLARAEPGRRSHPLPNLLRGEAGSLPPPRGLRGAGA